MKRSILCIICAFCLGFTCIPAFAKTAEDTSGEEKENLYSQYTATVPDKSNVNELITLDTVIEKSLNSSASNKKLSSSLELLENKREYYGETYSYSSSYDTLSSLLSSQTALKNAEVSKKVAEEEVKHSAKEVYATIVTQERNLIVKEEALKLKREELNIAQKKNQLGILSDEEFKKEKLEYETSKENYKNEQENLELSYRSLNILIGVDEENRYSFSMPLTYEGLALNTPIETYVKTKAQLAASVKEKKLELQSAEDKLSIRGLNEGTTQPYNYESLKNDESAASLSLEEQKEKVEDELRSLFNTIKNQESSINLYKSELERLKEQLVTAQTKYNSGIISNIELKSTELSVVEKEYKILNEMYSHMLNVEKFNNMNLF